MSVFSYHLTKTSYLAALKAILSSRELKITPGLIHAEYMTAMTLGAAIYSPERILARQVAMFAQWENEAAIDRFLNSNSMGQIFSKGWHTRLAFLRQWGNISAFQIPGEPPALNYPDEPVVAVTLARMKLPEIPRFIHWGRPVEKLVRDHPGVLFSTASIRLPRTVSTFTIWKSQQEMADMVWGNSAVPHQNRHVNAMKERERKDFHFEFTTLRFKPIAEFGEWNGRSNYIPNLKEL
ncbi:hypothetical protein [Chitinophaga sp.]|uniref:hypothetical protein n=1 Tax=Chitinophaga sp. TaxID=1869181 RepID=UPI002605FA47|nr:hypothetical protein [uncultured Chitinophaga sp.]